MLTDWNGLTVEEQDEQLRAVVARARQANTEAAAKAIEQGGLYDRVLKRWIPWVGGKPVPPRSLARSIKEVLRIMES